MTFPGYYSDQGLPKNHYPHGKQNGQWTGMTGRADKLPDRLRSTPDTFYISMPERIRCRSHKDRFGVSSVGGDIRFGICFEPTSDEHKWAPLGNWYISPSPVQVDADLGEPCPLDYYLRTTSYHHLRDLPRFYWGEKADVQIALLASKPRVFVGWGLIGRHPFFHIYEDSNLAKLSSLHACMEFEWADGFWPLDLFTLSHPNVWTVFVG